MDASPLSVVALQPQQQSFRIFGRDDRDGQSTVLKQASILFGTYLYACVHVYILYIYIYVCMYVHICAHVHIAKAGRWYAHAYSIEGGLHTRHAESADTSRAGWIWKGPRSGGRIILVISDASRDKAVKVDAANAVTNGPYLGRSRAGW